MTQSEPPCGQCGAKPGKFHKPGCEHEECPFCHTQLIGCGCCYLALGINPNIEPVYSRGLNPKQQKQWDGILRKKGLIPCRQEIRAEASRTWNMEGRIRHVHLICNEMRDAARKRSPISARRVKKWCERISRLLSSSPVLIEMNREYFLNGGTITWCPPRKQSDIR